MTQTTVNFVTGAQVVGTGSQATITTQSQTRVFDFAISGQAQLYYFSQISNMQQALQNIIGEGSGPLSPTDPNVQNFYNALYNLNSWSGLKTVSADGLTQTNNTSFTDATGATITLPVSSATGAPSSTMDRYMASALEQINRALLAASISPTSTTGSFDINTDIANGSTSQNTAGLAGALQIIAQAAIPNNGVDTYGLTNGLSQAITDAAGANVIGNAQSGTTGIQQALMVDFVATGNTILNDQMSQLNSAINVNQQALSYLNSLQDLMNQKDPQKFMLQLQNLSATSLTTEEPGTNNLVLPYQSYDNFEQQTFNQTLGATPNSNVTGTTTTGTTQVSGSSLPNSSLYNTAFGQLTFGNTTDINDPINTQTFVQSTQQIINNLNGLKNAIQSAGGTSASGGLVNSITTLINDFQPNPSDSSTIIDLKTWVTDSQGTSTGQYQNDLSAAITSSQSFNDTQRETLNEVMFVFEEFYQSAGGLLSSMNQLIQTIGKNAGS